jgi:outer membrane protein OmpA-like peptidoglycan-associated protein
MNRRRSLLALLPIALPVPAGAQLVAARPQGGWRVVFGAGEAALSDAGRAAVERIGATLAARRPASEGRVTVEGQASGPADDVSSARRLSLARAIAVREALVAGGLAATQVDVRALGRTEAALDIADILPPGTPRSGQVR